MKDNAGCVGTYMDKQKNQLSIKFRQCDAHTCFGISKPSDARCTNALNGLRAEGVPNRRKTMEAPTGPQNTLNP